MRAQLEGNEKEWNQVKRVFLLFLVTYFFLYMFPFPMDVIPFVGDLFGLYTKSIDFITCLMGKYMFGVPTLVKMERTGSGDKLFDFIRLFTIVVLSVPAWVVVVIFTGRKKNYIKLYDWFVVYARYYVGLYMVIYGFSKLDNGQFTSPGFIRLEQTYGNSSPMGLLWAFMGYSKTYVMCSGLIEIMGGFLLFFRRTTLLGSLITFTVLLHVVTLNFCYDVPVKLFSGHLLLLAIFIVAPYALRLYKFFILNTATEISYPQLSLPQKWMTTGRLILKTVLILCVPGYSLIAEVNSVNGKKTNESLNGTYITELFVLNKDTLVPLTSNAVRWSKMIIERGYVKITTMPDSSVYYKLEIDTVKRVVQLNSNSGRADKYFFTYENRPEDRFYISGFHNADSISVSFKRKKLKDYNLINRGFHWINEDPYNPY